MYGVTKRVLNSMACALALVIVWPTAPSAAQASPETMYNFAKVTTPNGVLRIGYRENYIPRTEHTHEILAAHLIWGSGYHQATYRADCATDGVSISDGSFYFWDGSTRGVRSYGHHNRTEVEDGIERPLVQAFGGYSGRRELIQAVICGTGPIDLSPVRVTLHELRQRFMADAGPEAWTQPWRMLTFEEGGDRTDRAHMQFSRGPNIDEEGLPRRNGFAVQRPTEPIGTAYWPFTVGTSPSDTLHHLVGIVRIEGEHGSSIDAMLDFFESGLGNRLVKRVDLAGGLVQIFATTDDGPDFVIHLKACPGRPGILYTTRADYNNLAQRIVAMRLINSMSVDCRRQ